MNYLSTWSIENTKLDTSISMYLNDVHALLCTRLNWLGIEDSYFENTSFEELKKNNEELYQFFMKYETSYANPDYAKKKLPITFYSVCSSYYYEVCTMVPAVFQNRRGIIDKIIRKFYVISDVLQGRISIDEIAKFEQENVYVDMKDQMIQMYGSHNFMTVMHKNINFSDNRYLFRYGIHISETELAFHEIAKSLSKDKIHALALQMVEGYLKGFRVRNKKQSSRKTARIVQIVGLEIIAHEILSILHKKRQVGMIGDLVHQGIDAQILFDHRQDQAIWCTPEYLDLKEKAYDKALSNLSQDVQNYQGNIIMVAFGQAKLDTRKKESAIKYSEQQNKWLKNYDISSKHILEHHIPKAEISFTGMAFPVNLIHPDYAKIFSHIMNINLMNSTHHEEIQEYLIDALDQGEFVEIIGRNGNDTNMRIHLQMLTDSKTQSNFVNCGADINIPVGEVYTTPQLQHSNGLLHIRQARISKVAFKDIRIKFEDGFVKEYSCQNTNDERKNHELMEEVIFHYRDTLPIGEFALGTNTYAYTVAKEDGILYKLHTLIFEKLGPHIAIGDTCFAWSEDNMMKSIYSGKVITAIDNEVSILRKQDVSKAYTGVHYDLTIPYEDIASIIIYRKDGTTISLIKDGLFVLEGCEDLNLPLLGK